MQNMMMIMMVINSWLAGFLFSLIVQRTEPYPKLQTASQPINHVPTRIFPGQILHKQAVSYSVHSALTSPQPRHHTS